MGDKVEVRREPLAHALDRGDRLDQEDDVARHPQAVLADLLEELLEHAAEVELRERRALELPDELPDVGAERAVVDDPGVRVAQAHHDVEHGVEFGGDHALHEVRELRRGARIDLPGHAAVDEGDRAVLEGEDVARVRIGVEEAELEAHAEDRVRAGGDDRLGAILRQVAPPHRREQRAVDLVHREDPPRGHRPVDLGEAHPRRGGAVARLLRPGPEEPGESIARASLVLEVDLASEFLRELPHHLGRAVREVLEAMLHESREQLQDVHVRRDDPLRIGPQDLEDDLAPVAPDRPVHLRHRGCGERGLVDRLEEFVEAIPELARKTLADQRERHRRDRRMQLRELRRPRRRNEIGPQAQDLPELHEGRAELLHREPQPLRQRHGLDGRIDRSAERPLQGSPQRAFEVQFVDDVAKAVPHQHREDLAGAAGIAEGASESEHRKPI